MKIAQIAPIIERVPPTKYGGTERVIFALTEELIRLGHDVTLFASGDSLTSAELISVYPHALRGSMIEDPYGPNPYSMLNIGLAYKLGKQFDIIHDHHNQIAVPTANLSQTPVVMTIHGALNEDMVQLFKTLNNINYVSISHAQTEPGPGINWVGNVYNGLQMESYPFQESFGDYLLFVGRISIEKGVHYAIDVAEHLGLKLIIAAKLEKVAVDQNYFRGFVEPRLSKQIQWIGEVDERERNKLMCEALCTLHPVTWREPFGLTLIEAMACGCPVVAFGLGSIPEIIVNGKTGFVVRTVEEMVAAVGNIKNIKKQDCREYALANFSATKMAKGYIDVYKKVLVKNEAKEFMGKRGVFLGAWKA